MEHPGAVTAILSVSGTRVVGRRRTGSAQTLQHEPHEECRACSEGRRLHRHAAIQSASYPLPWEVRVTPAGWFWMDVVWLRDLLLCLSFWEEMTHSRGPVLYSMGLSRTICLMS